MNTEAIATHIEEVRSVPGDPIVADTELLMSGIIDSLGALDLISWLEGEIGVSIDPGLLTFENFETPAAIAALCERVATSS